MKKAIPTILYINLIIFGITYIFSANGLYINNILSLYPITSDNFHLYQLITHFFAHANIEHIFFNMLFLIVFGPAVERYFGTRKFWNLYIYGGIFSSGLYCLGINLPILGASGAIFAVISAFIFTNKKDSIDFILFKFKIWIFISFLILFEFYLALFSNVDGIGHWAHVFGSIFGVVFFFFDKKYNVIKNG